MNASFAPSAYVHFQRALIALIAVNCVAYLLHGAAREALDSIAWFTLLVLFYAEISVPAHTRRALIAGGIRYARLAAGAVVVAAAWAYVDASAWLDAANSAAWIAVVVLLEAQMRYPAAASRHRRAFIGIAVLLYGALAVLPVAWLAGGEWLSAYDAALWLAAFLTIEMDVRPVIRRRRTRFETPR